MRVFVKKWGNSASVRIPASVMAAANLTLDQEVEVREDRADPHRVEMIEAALERHFERGNLLAKLPTSEPVEDLGEVWP